MNSVFLKVSSAFLINGHIAKNGEVVEVSETEAKDLLHRGKAELATDVDAPNVAVEGEEVEQGEEATQDGQPKAAKAKGSKKAK